ncbi:hypothetical protein FNV43_RR08617 [Rhamnella rubrinervis]|uniref:Uncharacterized protein n=1 Tax=Rhamnella rubrinervis TaxID=2594499 RepID=A0A8K0H8Y7_9ROSA|nr:hypothetical protein FNV43_RR08617 [Rhamnella rubrinervis]
MEAGSNVPARGEADDVVMVNAPASNSPDPEDCELKDLLSTIFETEMERLRQFCEIPRSTTFRKPEKREGHLEGRKGEIVVHSPRRGSMIPMRGFMRKWLFVNDDWEGFPTAGSKFRVPQGLVKVEWPAISTVRKNMARMVSTEPVPEAEEGSSELTVVDATKNIKGREASCFGNPGDTHKSRKMVGSFSKSTTPSKSISSTGVGPDLTLTNRVTWSQAERELAERYQSEKQQTPPPRPGNEGLTALISVANTTIHSQFRAQVDKESVERTSLGVINSSLQAAYQAMVTAQQLKDIKEELSSSRRTVQVLEGKYKMLEQALNIKENEKLAAVTRAEVAEKGLSKIDKKYQGTNTSLKNKDKEVEGLKNANQELSAELDELRKEGNENVIFALT